MTFASASEFAYFSARERPPALIFSENLVISDFMTDLDPKKSHVKQIFPDTTPGPKCPANISVQTDGRISKTIVRILSRKRKRHQHARNFCSPNFCFEAPAGKNLLGRSEPKPSLQVMYNSKWPRRRRKALKSRQRTNFVILRHVRGHQRRDIMKFSKFRILHRP